MSCLPSLAARFSFLGATLSPRRARLLLPLLALGFALPSLRAATFGDFQYNDTGTSITITGYTGSGGAVSIPTEIDSKPVTSIGDYAFYLCMVLTDVTIPNGVTSIGDYAFSGCFRLAAVPLPNSVISIGDHAFDGCSGLTSVTIPENVTSIGTYAFVSCSRLTSVTILSGVTSIGEYAFYYCSGLTRVTIPESVAIIGAWAFANCSGLTSVTIPKSVSAIGYRAFYSCDKLASAIFLGNAPSVGSSVFAQTASSFRIYFSNSSSYFTTPFWMGYPTQMGFPTYAQWIAGFGLGASDQLPDSNPSGDGLPNLVKYALGMNPALPAIDGQPVLVFEDGQLVYRVTLSLLTTGITSTIQTSADLVNWDDALTTIESSTATTVTASVTLPTGTPRRFARLAVTQP